MSRLAWLLAGGLAAVVALWGLLAVGLLGVGLVANIVVTATPLPSATPRPTLTPTAQPTPTVTLTPRRPPEVYGGPPIGAAPEPEPEATLAPAVDWPELPDLADRLPALTTDHFAVYANDPADALLAGLVETWGSELEGLLEVVGARLGRSLPVTPVAVVFARSYPARCPARGLASPDPERPLITIFAAEDTSPVQIRAVLAHEIVHQLTADRRFVGDGVLTEGIANWAAGDLMLAWQGYPSWDAATLDYLARRSYVSVADPTALNSRADEDCIARRDRAYNIRAAFVGWLVNRLGRETVLAMPYAERPERDPDSGAVLTDPDTGDVQMHREPDYLAATGYDLRTLELIWLRELWANR